MMDIFQSALAHGKQAQPALYYRQDDRMAGSVPVWAEPKSEQERIAAGLVKASAPKENFAAALAYADTMRFDDPDDVLISEECFHRTRAALQELYRDPEVPHSVRRDVLEASVHAPDEWHPNAVRQAYVQDDSSWRRTAVFCMSFIPGFEDEILESLRSSDEEVERNAVLAAGDQRVDDAWPHIVALIDSNDTPKAILLAAIDAVVNIRPEEAMEVIGELAESDDEDISEAAMDALALVDDFDEEFDEDDDGPDDNKRRS